MESARDKITDEIVDAEELWIINPVNPLGYRCRGCEAVATPCSYRPENVVRPYFRAKDGHEEGCDVDGEAELIKRARKHRVSTLEGFPGSFPNRLVLRDLRPVVDSGGVQGGASSQPDRSTGSKTGNKPQRNRHYAAQTIRSICRTFIGFPFDRDLPLSLPDVAAGSYQLAFRSLKRDGIISYPQRSLFYARISWAVPTLNDEYLEIQLGHGEWSEGKLIRRYRVRVDWRSWSSAKRNYVSREVEASRLEGMAAKKSGGKDDGWLFFIGRQDENDLALFHVDDHRLICCLVAEVTYPPKPNK